MNLMILFFCLVWLRLFNAELSLKRPEIKEVGVRETITIPNATLSDQNTTTATTTTTITTTTTATNNT